MNTVRVSDTKMDSKPFKKKKTFISHHRPICMPYPRSRYVWHADIGDNNSFTIDNVCPKPQEISRGFSKLHQYSELSGAENFYGRTKTTETIEKHLWTVTSIRRFQKEIVQRR